MSKVPFAFPVGRWYAVTTLQSVVDGLRSKSRAVLPEKLDRSIFGQRAAHDILGGSHFLFTPYIPRFYIDPDANTNVVLCLSEMFVRKHGKAVQNHRLLEAMQQEEAARAFLSPAALERHRERVFSGEEPSKTIQVLPMVRYSEFECVAVREMSDVVTLKEIMDELQQNGVHMRQALRVPCQYFSQQDALNHPNLLAPPELEEEDGLQRRHFLHLISAPSMPA